MPVTTEYIEVLLHTNPMPLYVVLICAALICTIFSVSIKGFKDGIKTSSVILSIIYAIFVICTTVAFRNNGSERAILFIPLQSYIKIFEGKDALLQENIMNVVAFMPIGVFLVIGARKLKWWQAALTGCSLSLVIEFMQFYFKRGQCEVDDVLHNTLGCVIGYYIVKAVSLFSYNHVVGKSNRQEL